MNILIGLLLGTVAYLTAVMYGMRYILGPRLRASREQYEVVPDEST